MCCVDSCAWVLPPAYGRSVSSRVGCLLGFFSSLQLTGQKVVGTDESFQTGRVSCTVLFG